MGRFATFERTLRFRTLSRAYRMPPLSSTQRFYPSAATIDAMGKGQVLRKRPLTGSHAMRRGGSRTAIPLLLANGWPFSISDA